MRASDENVDVVVIGAGPVGAAVTGTLATRGFRVVCLKPAQGVWRQLP